MNHGGVDSNRTTVVISHQNHGGSIGKIMMHNYPQMKIRLPPDVHAYVKEVSKQQERSMNSHITFLLRQEMEKKEEQE